MAGESKFPSTSRALTVSRWFHKFVGWLHLNQGSEPDFMPTVRRHKPFFDALGPLLYEHPLTGDLLIRHFGTAALRRHKLVTDFMRARLRVTFDETLKIDQGQRGSISVILAGIADRPFEPVVGGYATSLRDKALSLRTVRAYLTAAVQFCQEAAVGAAWDHQALVRFLKHSPGYRTSLSAFVTYCRDVLGWDVAMPSKGETGGIAEIEADAAAVAKIEAEIKKTGLAGAPTLALERLFARVFGYRLKQFQALAGTLEAGDGRWFFVDDGRVAIPARLTNYAAELSRRRSPD